MASVTVSMNVVSDIFFFAAARCSFSTSSGVARRLTRLSPGTDIPSPLANLLSIGSREHHALTCNASPVILVSTSTIQVWASQMIMMVSILLQKLILDSSKLLRSWL